MSDWNEDEVDAVALAINAKWNEIGNVPFPLYQQEAEDLARAAILALRKRPAEMEGGFTVPNGMKTPLQKELESFFQMRVAFSHRLQNDPDYQDLVADFLAIQEECSMLERTIRQAEAEFAWIKNELPKRFGDSDFEDMGAFSRRLRDRAANWIVPAVPSPEKAPTLPHSEGDKR